MSLLRGENILFLWICAFCFVYLRGIFLHDAILPHFGPFYYWGAWGKDRTGGCDAASPFG